jgi:hypothetical protein
MTSEQTTTLDLDSNEKAVLWNALQDLIGIRESEGKDNEVEDLWSLFNKLRVQNDNITGD